MNNHGENGRLELSSLIKFYSTIYTLHKYDFTTNVVFYDNIIKSS